MGLTARVCIGRLQPSRRVALIRCTSMTRFWPWIGIIHLNLVSRCDWCETANSYCSSGSEIVKVEPCPGSLETLMLPL